MATHKDLITVLKFDNSFKNALRNYYAYGFQGIPKEDLTLNQDWSRLQNILADYLQWSSSKKRIEVAFASVDSQEMDHNPFQRVYRCCKYKHLDYLYHTMSACVMEEWNSEYLDRLLYGTTLSDASFDLLTQQDQQAVDV